MLDFQNSNMQMLLENPSQPPQSYIQHEVLVAPTTIKTEELPLSENLIASPLNSTQQFSLPSNYYTLTSNPSEQVISDAELSDGTTVSSTSSVSDSVFSSPDFGSVMVPAQACQPPLEARQFSIVSDCPSLVSSASSSAPSTRQPSLVLMTSPVDEYSPVSGSDCDFSNPCSSISSPAGPLVSLPQVSTPASTASPSPAAGLIQHHSTSHSHNHKIKSKFQSKKCSICGKYITRDITRHIRTHDVQSRFKCIFPPRQCLHKTKQFNRPYDFKKHLLNSHFEFDNCEVKKLHNLNDKLPCYGTCKCGLRLTGKEWLDHVLKMDSEGKSIECPYLRKFYKESGCRPPVQKFITR
ncbi:unnamed protein product [Ambrosiozyma monospora]|uniref:Unnamed protein product n=1 Tax=Ambrosiozyma monospora TaxID=43982 RepID=A0ACB5TFK8_AMBMO|nr:unnamed protein product [Ambrosiozyma monospora]